VFLTGGPAFSGTTLLALLLNQGSLLCLDEPDFHDPEQRHRGIPFLRELHPEAVFPDPPERELSFEEATDLIERCECAISPHDLGIKTCNSYFVGYADVYRRRGYPVICIVRDVRDALASPLPSWETEEKMNRWYRLIWERREEMDLWFRYEELVTETEAVLARVAAVLGHSLRPLERWPAEQVSAHMLKSERHELLKAGSISRSRVGVWKTSGRQFSLETLETARLMGY
jgi:hypothetical protein